jgi:hypothetical protein
MMAMFLVFVIENKKLFAVDLRGKLYLFYAPILYRNIEGACYVSRKKSLTFASVIFFNAM